MEVPIFIEQEEKPRTSIVFWIPDYSFPSEPQINEVHGLLSGSNELSEIEDALCLDVQQDLKDKIFKGKWYYCDVRREIEDQFTTSYHFVNLKEQTNDRT